MSMDMLTQDPHGHRSSQHVSFSSNHNEASEPAKTSYLNGYANSQHAGRPDGSGKPKPPLLRTQSDTTFVRRISADAASKDSDNTKGQLQEHTNGEVDKLKLEDAGWHMRHGWDAQYTAEALNHLSSNFYMYFNDKRHETNGNTKDNDESQQVHEWRMRDRLKTVSALLAICLNIGVDPPDVFKTNPCARLECWHDPTAPNMPPGNPPINQIGKQLQQQYELLSMRTRYKILPDPTVDETKKYCITLRKNAKDERILFHYNGHGVPKPTPSGEIWVFNKNYTQYIPISLYDLQSWLGAPSLFVYDCSDAGLIIKNFNKFIEKHDADNMEQKRKDPSAQVASFSDCIHLAACQEKENLPTNPHLPADLFTSCLTTPIDIAVRFFIMQNPLQRGLVPDDFSKIPGRSTERKTPIGELNWIFTAITDTIAWNCLSKSLFKKLFRQDLMVAALFRNFLLAQRIMRTYHCHPQCHPEIPSTHDHPLWDSWDLAIEMVLSQLPNLIAAEKAGEPIEKTYRHSDFFAEQLTAFEVYLEQGAMEQKEPEQLPIVLQVLLSQQHRLRALVLLSRFLDLGPWAVKLALGIGIFPYVLKLLQSQATELKPVLIFIWARILAVDPTCQTDLLKDGGYQYFVTILNPVTGLPVQPVSDHRAMCAFIIAMFCKDFPQGQKVCLSSELVESCLSQVSFLATDSSPATDNPLLRQWACLCLGVLWDGLPEAQWAGIRSGAPQRLCDVAQDPVPEVRAAMLYAVSTLLGIPDLTDQVATIEEFIASSVMAMANDGSGIVRKELVIFFSQFVKRYENKFIVAAYEQMLEEARCTNYSDRQHYTVSAEANGSDDPSSVSADTVVSATWKHLLVMSVDPDPEVVRDAIPSVNFVLKALIRSPLGVYSQPLMDEILQSSQQSIFVRSEIPENYRMPSRPPSPAGISLAKQDSYLSISFKRTASVAASLKQLAFGTSSPGMNDVVADIPTSRSLVNLGRIDRSLNYSKTLPIQRPTIPEEPITANQSSYQPSKFPKPKFLRPRSNKESEVLPLESSFFNWSVEYFREPQMKPSEADEPGSADYNERLWRRSRNEKILSSTQILKEHAGSSRWDNNTAFFDNGVQPMKMCFHQYENHLVVTDDKDMVRVWDWELKTPLNRFSNGNPFRSKITDSRFINEDDQALLMVGSSDGIVKLFRNYDVKDKVHVVSAFRALIDLVPSNRNAGLVFDWLQGQGSLLVAGDVKKIRVWNASAEMCVNEMPARSGSCITSLTSDQVEGHVFVAGFGDGAVRVYDQRRPNQDSMVMKWKEHRQWITNVHMQRGGQRELISGCRNGEVKLWDIRMGASLKTINASRDTLRTLSVHEHAPVFATGSERHNIKVFNVDGSPLSSFEPYSSFLYQNRSAPIATTAFHPHHMMLACAAFNDNHVNLFSCLDQRKRHVVHNSVG